MVAGISGGTADFTFGAWKFAPGTLFGLNVIESKVLAAPVVLDSKANGKLYLSPISLARFEENAGRTNTSLVRLEGHAAYGVERTAAAVRIASSYDCSAQKQVREERMNTVRRHQPSPATAIALAALFVALGGVAFAAIPDSNGTVHACYQKNSGNLRAVSDPSGCRNNEQRVDLASQANQPSSRILWAVVRGADGTLLRGKGAVSAHLVSSAFGFSGIDVVFDRDLSACAYSMTLEGPSGGGEGIVHVPAGHPDTLRITVPNDDDGHVAAFC